MSHEVGPRANIEIKARLRDMSGALRTAHLLGAQDVGADHHVDTYYGVTRGRLKLRTSMFAGEELILYIRPDTAGPRRADYQVLPVPPAGRTRELLDAMFGVEVQVEKTRRIFLLGDTRIHLDTVTELGTFIEFEAVYFHGNAAAEEAARREVERLMSSFSVAPEDLIPLSYRDLLLTSRRL